MDDVIDKTRNTLCVLNECIAQHTYNAKMMCTASCVDSSVSLAYIQFYTQGVFDYSGCSSTKLNHPVLLIGYGSTHVDNALTEYWLLKNR